MMYTRHRTRHTRRHAHHRRFPAAETAVTVCHLQISPCWFNWDSHYSSHDQCPNLLVGVPQPSLLQQHCTQIAVHSEVCGNYTLAPLRLNNFLHVDRSTAVWVWPARLPCHRLPRSALHRRDSCRHQLHHLTLDVPRLRKYHRLLVQAAIRRNIISQQLFQPRTTRSNSDVSRRALAWSCALSTPGRACSR